MIVTAEAIGAVGSSLPHPLDVAGVLQTTYRRCSHGGESHHNYIFSKTSQSEAQLLEGILKAIGIVLKHVRCTLHTPTPVPRADIALVVVVDLTVAVVTSNVTHTSPFQG
jgi:hypothetical protein